VEVSAEAVVLVVVEAALAAADPREDGRMQTLSEQFLTKDEQELITQAVQEAERSTSGEIVPMITSCSHNYPMAAATCSISLAMPLALLLTHLIGGQIWIGPQNMWLFLGLFALLYVILYPIIMRTDRLKYYFLNRKEVEQEVREAALAAFYSEQLYKTENDNGILLYISVLEQKVWILADTNINAKIDQKEWDSVVLDLTTGIKAGKRCEAICEAVHRIGLVLQNHFPYLKDDKDELHNLIVR
jgi:putative membrane protein